MRQQDGEVLADFLDSLEEVIEERAQAVFLSVQREVRTVVSSAVELIALNHIRPSVLEGTI